jgi:hypothetical protein
MLLIIQSKIFCLPVSYKKVRLKYTKLYFYQLYCVGAKLGPSLGGTQSEGFSKEYVEDIWT